MKITKMNNPKKITDKAGHSRGLGGLLTPSYTDRCSAADRL